MSQTGQAEKAEPRAEQEKSQKPVPQKEHQWLQKLVGEWTYEFEATPEPGKPPQKMTGTQSARSLGGLWVIAEARADESEGDHDSMIVTLGYDPDKKRFVGTWIGSMMASLWIYDGELDPSGKVLRLDSEGASMSGDGTTSEYQDALEFMSDDRYVMRSSVLGQDGKWTQFMTMEFRRRK